eukprot:COSAG02_NODE_6998_length_3236_cov_1.563277_1_plen_457_part_00
MEAESARGSASMEAARPPRKRKATKRGGCCAAKPARQTPHDSVSAREKRSGNPAATDVTTTNEASQPLAVEIPAECEGSIDGGSAKLPGLDGAVDSLAESNERRSAVLLSAKVTGSERLQTDETRWVGGDPATAMHYRIEGTMRCSDGSECAFAALCRYSLLHELHERMSHDRLGAHSVEEREQLRRGLALFPEKKWIGGNSVVSSRELQISRWLDYWATLAGSIEHTGDKVKILHSALARCSALICEFLNQETGTSDTLRKPSYEVAPRVLFDRDNATASSALENIRAEYPRGGGSEQPSSVALRVRIRGVRSPVGAIRLVVWDSSNTWLDEDRKCCHHRCALSPSEFTGEMFEATLPPLPVLGESGQPIAYAMMAIHDIHDTGKLHTNEFGIPRDGICCTNGATGGAQGPKWSAAKFFLVSTACDIVSSDCLHYWLMRFVYTYVLPAAVGAGRV